MTQVPADHVAIFLHDCPIDRTHHDSHPEQESSGEKAAEESDQGEIEETQAKKKTLLRHYQEILLALI